MRDILMLLLAGLLADNIICFRCIGIGNNSLSTDTLRRSAMLGLFITAAGTISVAVMYPLYQLLLLWNIAFLKTLFIIAVCAAAVLAGKKLFPQLLDNFTSAQGAVAFGTVLGICCLCFDRLNFLHAVLAALFYGIGLLLVLCLFFCARLSLKPSRIPKALVGIPLDLIIISIISLVIYGWRGVNL